MVNSPIRKATNSNNSREAAIKERSVFPFNDESVKLDKSLKSQYDMWSWIFPEIATYRMETSRLGSAVRINEQGSPEFLNKYLCQMKALLLGISIIDDDTWKKTIKEHDTLRNQIAEFNKQRSVVTNKKIPQELIDKLDNFYRLILLLAQKHGLGIKIADSIDIDKAIEDVFAS